MRVLLLLAGVLAALAFVLAGCGGDEEQQPQATAEQQQETTARSRPAQPQQSTQAQAEDEQAVAEPQQEEAAATVEQPARFDDPLLDEAYAAYATWAEGLESIELEVEADFNLGGLAAQMSATVAARFEPLTILMTLDASQLFSMFADAGDDDTDDEGGLLLMAILMTEESVYLSMPQAEGWVDLSSEAEGVLEGLTGILGGDPSALSDPGQLGLAFGCIDAVGGSATVGSHNGEAAWIVDCEIDVDGLNEAAATALQEQGIEVVDAGIEAMHLRLAISQETGAPLLIETEMTVADAFGFSDDGDDGEGEPQFYINTVTHLSGWNESIDFPAPEPIIEGSLMDAFASDRDGDFAAEGSGPPELLNAEQLIDLNWAWTLAAAELELQFVTQAVIDGEVRLASTLIRRSRSQGTFETAVQIDGGSAIRLLWNQGGIWVSDSEEDGDPIWTASNPALLGFAGQSVDEFLDELDSQGIDALRELSELAWVTRTIEGNQPPIYELVIESGYRVPGDPYFDLIAEMLRIDTAELLAENVSIDEIDHFSLTITMKGGDGELVSQVTAAEFVTNAGRVELLASLNLVSDGPIVFSTPPE